MRFLEANGCIHRDIKPANILCNARDGHFQISDFGCSILLPRYVPFKDPKLEHCFQMELNKIIGTPAFIAPELCHFNESKRNNIRDGFKLDIWSLGITLYCLLHNKLPFSGENEFDTYHKVVSESLDSDLDDVPLNNLVIEKLLKKNPRERVSIHELSALIETSSGEKHLHLNSSSKNKIKKSKTSIKTFFHNIFSPKHNKSTHVSTQPIEPRRERVYEYHTNPHSIISKGVDDADDFVDLSSASGPSLASSYDDPIQVTEFIDYDTAPRIQEMESLEDINGTMTNQRTYTDNYSNSETDSPKKRRSTNTSSSFSPIKLASNTNPSIDPD